MLPISSAIPPSASIALSGILFGAALTATGVYSPGVIVAQMQLRDWHMLKVFLAGSACSAFIMHLLNTLGFSTSKPRPPSNLKHLPPYSANALGGICLGLGMTLTGACPGTVFPQIATGIPSGPLVLFGGTLAGILWTRFGTSLKQTSRPVPQLESPKVENGSSAKREGVFSPALLVYESCCLLGIVLTMLLAPPAHAAPIHPVIGGLLIGAAQASSILFTGSPLGVSTAYEDAGAWFWHWAKGSANLPPSNTNPRAPRPSTRSISFALSMLVGSYVFSKLSPDQLAPSRRGFPGSGLDQGKADIEMSKLTAILGGCIMIFGVRLAGGCTSGHGISGMAMLGPSSFITVGGMFVGGMGLAAFLR